jgi:glycosyltransferase involved in cell wall biosynthesis
MRLMRELGPRGMLETAARIVGRPAVAMFPPVRKTQQAAAVILVQNPDTGRRLRGPGRMKLLSNALAVELNGVGHPGPRTADLFVVGRLVPWKAPILALRALRYVEHREAVLRFFGDGPEQSHLERAAQEWGLGDRVRFEGWIDRPELIPQLARAGALIHPALHEEAGLCIAEALTLGTPVVVLDHGGPSQIVGQWRGTPSALVRPRNPEATARRMAAAIDAFLADPPPVPQGSSRGRTSFEEEVLAAYDFAAGESRHHPRS